MIKGGIFLGGLVSGTYLGVYLREYGYSTALTRAYYAYQNEDYGKKKIKHKASLEEVFEYYNKGLLEGEQLDKFINMVNAKQYDKVDEIVVSNLEDVLKSDPAIADIRRKQINRLYEK
jgi:hypothetical protein